MKRDGINDCIVYGEHKDTGEYHGMFYINHPTPSGSPRMMLWHSTKLGYKTPQEAINAMVAALKPEALVDTDIFKIKNEENQ